MQDFVGPPPAVAKKKAWPWIVGGITGILLLCCGIGVVGAMSGDTAKNAEPNAGPTKTAPAVVAEQATLGRPCATLAVRAITAAGHNVVCSDPDGDGKPQWVEVAAEKTTPPAPTVPPTSAAAPKPRVINGSGDDVVEIPALTELAVLKFSCPRCTSNTVLKSDGDGLLVNEIGAYIGKRWINLEESSQTTQFEVEARGKWTLTIGTVDQLATKAPSGKAAGRGDDVILLGGAATTAKITHSKGQSNFAVHAYNLETGRGGLLVNEIGGYSGTRPLAAPALVQVTADGNWTITPA